MMFLNRKKRILTGMALTLVIVAGVYLYGHYNPEEFRFYPKCPVYLLTGYQCPGCGSQRAFHHLFQGDFATAFQYNPLVMLLIPYILTGIYIEYIANRTKPAMVRIREVLFGKWAILSLAIIIIMFTFFRNFL
jgi:hypothetical protein